MDKSIRFSSEQPSTILRSSRESGRSLLACRPKQLPAFYPDRQGEGRNHRRGLACRTRRGPAAASFAVGLHREARGLDTPRFHRFSDATGPAAGGGRRHQARLRWESEVGWEMSQPFLPQQTPLLRAVLLYEAAPGRVHFGGASFHRRRALLDFYFPGSAASPDRPGTRSRCRCLLLTRSHLA